MSKLSIGQQILVGINQSLDLLFTMGITLGLIFSSISMISGIVELIIEKKEDKEKKLRRIHYQKRQLNEILKNLDSKHISYLTYNLNKKGTDLYLVFALPHCYFPDTDIQNIFHKILKEVFDTHTNDSYLWKWFDDWIEDYVKDVFLPALLEKKHG